MTSCQSDNKHLAKPGVDLAVEGCLLNRRNQLPALRALVPKEMIALINLMRQLAVAPFGVQHIRRYVLVLDIT